MIRFTAKENRSCELANLRHGETAVITATPSSDEYSLGDVVLCCNAQEGTYRIVTIYPRAFIWGNRGYKGYKCARIDLVITEE